MPLQASLRHGFIHEKKLILVPTVSQ